MAFWGEATGNMEFDQEPPFRGNLTLPVAVIDSKREFNYQRNEYLETCKLPVEKRESSQPGKEIKRGLTAQVEQN